METITNMTVSASNEAKRVIPSAAVERNALSVISSYGYSPSNLAAFTELAGDNARAYIGSALMAVRFTPALWDCEPDSIFQSALRAASVKLSCDPSLGHAYLVPFKDRKSGGKNAQLIIGYKGLYQIALRSGLYEIVNVSTLYEGQIVEEDYVTGEYRVTGYTAKGRSASTRIGQMAYFKMRDGFAKALYMTKSEIHDHARRYSKGYDRADGVWKTNPEAMEKKTVLRLLLSRWGFLDPMASRVLGNEDIDRLDGEHIPVGSMTSAELAMIEGQETPDDAVIVQDAIPAGWDNETIDDYLMRVSDRPEIKMSLDEARNTKNSHDQLYGDQPIETLAEWLPRIGAAIAKAKSDDERFNLELRRNAILTIFEHERTARGLYFKMEDYF